MAAPAPPTGRLGRRELIALLSMVMALGALGIDLMLPAFTEMRAEFGLVADSNRVAAVVTAYVLGLAGGTLVFGPLSDRFGRKAALYVGFAVYGAGAIGSALAPSLEVLLVVRAFWGFGAAAPRTIALSIVRDLFSGDRMARLMSFVFAIFIVVPVVAPTLGAGIIAIAPWRWVFWGAALFVAVVALWTLRLGETLDPTHRRTLRPADLTRAARIVVGNRQTTGHMLALTMSFGAFVSYLATSQLIVEDILDRASLFPLVFGGLAAAMGAAMLVNASLVERLGTVRMLRLTLRAYVAAAFGFLILALGTGGTPGLVPFVLVMAALLSMHALLIPNTNSRAMDPMGAVAGTASAIIGAIATGGGAVFGAALDGFYNGTITPLAVGFVVSSLGASFFVRWAEREPAPASQQ
jgi:DHA1 family bicyclomycin/chloramphenicol resistance-like MFS transporter